MVIHAHHSPNPIAGDTKRVINIDRDVAGLLSADIVEVEYYSLRSYKYVHSQGRFVLSPNVKKKYYVPNIEHLGLLNDFWCSLVISFLFIKYKPQYYIEEWKLPRRLLNIRKIFSKTTTLLLDLHGAAPEEYKYTTGKTNSSLEMNEAYSVMVADKIICQSDEMKRHLVMKHSCNSDKITIYRCGVDTSVFYYADSLRERVRSNLGIKANEIVFVYSGGMHKWQKIEEALKYYRTFHAKYNDSKMLILTKDTNVLDQIIKNEKIEDIRDSMIVRSLAYTEVPAFLCAADVSFLIRDNVVMNAVASPTKLAEYMACGLPVISTSVAQKWVTEDGLKYIIDYEITDIDQLHLMLAGFDKSSISNYSANTLSLEIDKNIIKDFFSKA